MRKRPKVNQDRTSLPLLLSASPTANCFLEAAHAFTPVSPCTKYMYS